jgi:hypothetical protein
LVNNYHLIKKDNKLDILFDNYIFEYIKIVPQIGEHPRFYIFNFICFNYVYKIYINRVNNIIETNLDEEQLNKSLLNLKNDFSNKFYYCTIPISSQIIEDTYMYKILNVLNKKIDEKSDIFRNFDKKYARYYPIEIITLYNFYMHN